MPARRPRTRSQWQPNISAGNRCRSRTIPWIPFPPHALHASGPPRRRFSRDFSGYAVQCFPATAFPRKSSHATTSATQWLPRSQPPGDPQHESLPWVPPACQAGGPRIYRHFYELHTTASLSSPGRNHRRFSESEKTCVRLALPRLRLPFVAGSYTRTKKTFARPPATLDPLSGP